MPYIIKNGKTYGGVNSKSANEVEYKSKANSLVENTNDVQSAVDILENYAFNIYIDNLLDNPFFTVNQRGNSEYVLSDTSSDNYIYTVDRWNLAGNHKLVVLHDGVMITCVEDGVFRFQQSIDKKNIKGKEVTLSINIGENTISGIVELVVSNSENVTYDTVKLSSTNITGNSNCIISTTFTLPENFDYEFINVGVIGNDVHAGEYIKIKSIKLEYGNTSTLVNDTIPKYSTELRKCQYCTIDPNDNYANNKVVRFGIDENGNYGYYKDDNTFKQFMRNLTISIDGVPYEEDTLVLQTDEIIANLSMSTLPYDFYWGSAVVYNNEIHILSSGASGKTAHYKFNGSTWTSVSTLPYEFYYGCAVVYNNEIHILGGRYNSDTYKYHYKYNGTTWTSVSTLPYEFYYGSAVVLNNEIHILGSGDSNYYKYHYKYNGTTWTSVSTLPYEFYYGSAVVLNNEIHILGSGSGNYTKHYKYNGSTWTSVSTLPYRFYYGCAVVYNNEIHILGGNGGNTAHYKYNGNTWTQVSTLPYRFYWGSAVVLNNEIHIMGSYDSSSYKYHYSIEKLRYNILQ